MATLSPKEIGTYARTAGFSTVRRYRGQREDVVATAIALCESGGNTRAHNTRGEDSRGLWQINWNNVWEGQLPGIPYGEMLFLPSQNARAAKYIHSTAGNSFRDWSCYNNGGWLRHLDAANRGIRGEALEREGPIDEAMQGIGERVGDIIDPLTGLADIAGFVTNRENWLRVAMFVGGGIILTVAGVMFVGQSKTLQNVATTAATRGIT